MVSKKRLDYGFNGFHSPIVPRAPRSIRKRSPEKDLDDSNMCSFELLATVAGKLLKESESSSSSNAAEGKLHPGISRDENDKGPPANDSFLKSKSHDQGSCAESAFVPEYSVQERNLLSNFKAENDSILEHTSEFASSDLLNEIDCNILLGICEDKAKVESESETQSSDDKKQIGELTLAHTSTKKDPNGECVNKTNVLINYESSVQPSLYRDPLPSAFVRKQWDHVKLGIRDDDENSSFRCNKSSTRIRPFRPQARTAHRRQRKMMTSRYWKATPKMKDCELYKTNNGMRTFYRYRKSIYERERYHQAPTKKRKLYDDRFGVSHNQSASSDSVSNLPACGGSATAQGHQRTKDPHVKFSIKSFRVPELYIEVPETATVGSLKRTVLEAVTAILGGGIRVGMALQGKKVRDDSRTLQQAGISRTNTLDTLGFTLEPSFAHVSPCLTPKNQHPLVLQCDADQTLPRSPGTPMIDSGISNASIETPFVLPKLDEEVDIKNIISSPKSSMCALTHGINFNGSKALVPLPSSMNAEALAVVPLNPKPKRSELSQRRTRRPFSVGEVEALVEAVEKLGTGRWRDVKMRAFENAEHRTYVDLKDKWKTLVHTASIAPQQRRGEPVPQNLLDRVLSAHSFWTQNQPRQHAKLAVESLKIAADAHKEEIVGA